MSRSDNQQPHISFDDEYRVRVLDKESITHTQELEVESNQFATSTQRVCSLRFVCGLSIWRRLTDHASVARCRVGGVPRDHQGRARGPRRSGQAY